eukprot:7562170-Pyramimonas_sp.AAC.1
MLASLDDALSDRVHSARSEIRAGSQLTDGSACPPTRRSGVSEPQAARPTSEALAVAEDVASRAAANLGE